jgi:excisionase family DNA binding protein
MAEEHSVKTRKTTTTIEIHEVYVVRQPQPSAPLVCPECATGVASMVTPEEAARLAQISKRHLYRLLENGKLHYLEGEGDSLLICLHSLPAKRNADDVA